MAARRPALVRDGYQRVGLRRRMEAKGRPERWAGPIARLATVVSPSGHEGDARGVRMTRVALINPNWNFDGSIYFGCRSPHLPLELGISQHYLEEAGHACLLLDAHMFDLSLRNIETELIAFRPDIVVVTTAPTYLFWRCAPPELRVPQQLTLALRDLAPLLVAVGPHGSTTPRPALKKLAVDIVVMGECEHALLRLANGERDF